MDNKLKRIYYSLESNSLIARNAESESLNKSISTNKLKIIIFGASGGTGKELINEALKNNHKVIAAVRNPNLLAEYKDKIEIREINLKDPQSVINAIKDGDVVVSSLGAGGLMDSRKPTTLFSDSIKIIIDAMKKNNVKRGLFITSGGVEYDSNAPWFYRNIIKPLFLMNTYMDMIKMETLVETEGKSLDWTLVRPSYLLNGKTEKFTATERLIRQGTFKINRIDLAKFVIHEIENNLWVHGYPALSY